MSFIDADTDQFVLDRSEWRSIQVYTLNALSLPITEPAMIQSFHIPKEDNGEVNFVPFTEILSEYQSVYTTADGWNRNYPKIVQLALSLANYSGIHTAFFNELYNSLDKLHDAAIQGDYETAEIYRKAALSILRNLQTFSQLEASKTLDVTNYLIDFSAEIKGQAEQLDRLENEKADIINTDNQELKDQIDTLQADIDRLNREYNEAVTIAATTPTYAWIPFYGWVVGPTVAGVYTDQAIKLKNERDHKIDQLKELESKLTHQELVYSSLKFAKCSMKSIKSDIDVIRPHVEKILTHWQDIGVSFDSMLVALDLASGEDGLGNAVPIVASMLGEMQVDLVNESWKEVSDKAKQFANNAYIQVERSDS